MDEFLFGVLQIPKRAYKRVRSLLERASKKSEGRPGKREGDELKLTFES